MPRLRYELFLITSLGHLMNPSYDLPLTISILISVGSASQVPTNLHECVKS